MNKSHVSESPLNFKVCIFLTSLFLLTTLKAAAAAMPLRETSLQTTGPVKPSTPLITFLESLQETALTTYGSINFDPKLYVDLSLKFDLITTQNAFTNIPRSKNGSVSGRDFELFLEKYFNGAGDDLVYVEPVDFADSPSEFLPLVDNLEVRHWALEVHGLWKNLSREVSADARKLPEYHTLLPLPEPAIVPGSRFREVYYWDSYWVIRGLLASKMYQTAKSIVVNLISLIDAYGFVLNGARSYYTNRSQPPLLSSMIYDIYIRTGDQEFVKKCFPALIKEHTFWTSGIHKVTIKDARGMKHSLSRYYAMWNTPRPESSTIDIDSASKLVKESEKQLFYRELATTAESGWDFSTRWMRMLTGDEAATACLIRNSSDLTTLSTTSILPVDLNAFILKMELDIAFLAEAIQENSIAKRFLIASQVKKDSINTIFWNEQKGQWLDYWLHNDSSCKDYETWDARRQNSKAFASNFVPLWVESFHSDDAMVRKALDSLQGSGLVGAAGISTSNTVSGQQWDAPNGWAPLQHMIIEGLARSKSREARSMSFELSTRWIKTNYAAYKKTGTMHEKYDVTECGKTGGGGEYIPQTGFGWSNGVVLVLLEELGWPKDLKMDC